MRALLGLLISLVLSSLGWWIGAQADLGLAVVLGAIGAGAGLYWGRRLYDDWLG